jgi:hypothetical protein
MSPTRLVLHVGLPKTGSCALQMWCHRNRDGLRRRGVHFPRTGAVPKHQFLVYGLHGNRLDRLHDTLAASEADTILLSSEGLSNGLYDFRPAALESFRRITRDHDVTVFVIARDATAWTRSYYKQLVITAPSAEFYWGTSLEYEDFCGLSRVQRLCDIAALQEDLCAAFGATVVVARHEAGWMDDFLGVLRVSDIADLHPLTRENISVSDDVVELVRQVNGMGLTVQDRASFITALRHPAGAAADSLKFLYPIAPGAAESPRSATMGHVLNRLRPRTATQAQWIEDLRQD